MDKEKMTDDLFDALFVQAAANNRQCVAMFEDKDGNWRGAYAKEGEKSVKGEGNRPSVFVRAINPETVLQMLLTHDGQ